MAEEKSNFNDRRVLVVAPSGHDAENTLQVLSREQIAAFCFPNIEQACETAQSGVGALIFTQESLTGDSLECIGRLIRSQPAWSDIPLILLSNGGEATSPALASVRNLGFSGALTVLERPLRVVTLVTAVRTALRSRQRQYEVRDLLFQREAMMKQLEERAGNLETSQAELMTAKERIDQHARELEHTVEERTARLREMLAQLETFSYSISHDMRGPLRAMQQYSQILLEDFCAQMPPEGLEYLKRIVRGANRLDRLIQDVLTYSRAARTAMPVGPVDLDKLIRDIIQQYPTFQPPEAKIEILAPLPRVLGHEASLTQCVSNLLGNAVKFVPPGEKPEVKIYTGESNGTVRIWFEDNGIGIAPENQQRIFNIFERIHHQSEYEGTGIGLSIVKKTVERMGGEVGLESAVGKGSKFWIKLPAAEPDKAD